MSQFDAYEGEMRILSRSTDDRAERLLSGRAAADEPELTAFLSDLRAEFDAPPPANTEEAHLALMEVAAAGLATVGRSLPALPTARPTTATARARRGARRRLALAGASLVVGIPLLTVGLAVAGVSLPSAARAPFKSVGIDLPNQGSRESTDAVQAIIESTPPSERGCTFGQAVAAAASEGKLHPQNACANGEPQAKPAHQGKTGQANGARTASDPGGRSFGQSTAAAAQELGQQQSAAGQAAGQSQGAPGASGSSNSAAGQAHAPTQATSPPEAPASPPGRPTAPPEASASSGHGP